MSLQALANFSLRWRTDSDFRQALSDAYGDNALLQRLITMAEPSLSQSEINALLTVNWTLDPLTLFEQQQTAWQMNPA